MNDKGRWTIAAEAVVSETKIALQTVFDELNQGQKKKLLKSDRVKKLVKQYGARVEEMLNECSYIDSL